MKNLRAFETNKIENLISIYGGTSPNPDDDGDKDKAKRPTGSGGSGTDPNI